LQTVRRRYNIYVRDFGVIQRV